MALKIGELFVSIGARLDDLQKGVEDAQKKLRSLGADLEKTGEGLSKAITLPLAGIATASVVAFAGFQQGMAKVSALGDVFGADLEKLRKQAMQLGADTQYSAKQAADAMGNLAASGFKANEIFAAMPGLLSLAATEQMDLADAAQITSDVIKGFGISVNDTQKIADVLAKTSSSSATSVKELGYAFSYAGPIAKEVGLSFLDTAAALGRLADAGVRGERGGTALRNLLNDLLAPSKAGAEALNALKISVKDAQGNLLPMEQILKNIAPLMQDAGARAAVFGQRWGEVALLVGKSGEEFKKIRQEVENFNGAAEKQAKIMRDTIGGAWEQFTGSVETAGIKLGAALAPTIAKILEFGTKVANALGDAAEWFDKLPGPIKTFTIAVAGIAAAVGPAVLALGTMATMVGNLRSIPSTLGLVADGFKFFAAGGFSFKGALDGIAVAARMAGPAIAVLAAAWAGWKLGNWLVENVPMVRKFGEALGDLILKIPGARAAIEGFKGAPEGMGDAIARLDKDLQGIGITLKKDGGTWDEYFSRLREAWNKNAPQLLFKELSDKLGGVQDVGKKFTNALAEIKLAFDGGKLSSGDYMKQLQEIEKGMKGLQPVVKQTADAHDQLGKIGAKTAAEIVAAQKEMEKAAKSQAKEAEKAAKAAARSLDTIRDKVADFVRDLPKSSDEFARAMAEGFSPKAAIRSLKEQLSDIERMGPLAAAKLAPIRHELEDQITSIGKWNDAWDMDALVKEAEEMAMSMKRLDPADIFKGFTSPTLPDMFGPSKKEIDKLQDSFQRLGVTFDATFAKTGGQFRDLNKGVLTVAEATRTLNSDFEKVASSGQLSAQELQKVWVGYLEKKVALEKKANADIKIETDGLWSFLIAQTSVSTAEMALHFAKSTENIKNTISSGLKNAFTQAFSGDFSGALKALSTSGGQLVGALEDLVVGPFKKKFQDFLGELANQIGDFVTKHLVGTLMKGFDGVLGKMPLVGDAFQKVFGASNIAGVGKSVEDLANVGAKAAEAAAQATKAATAAAEGAKAAAEVANASAKASTQAAQAVKTASDAASNAAQSTASAFTQVMGVVNVISGVISAVTGVLQYLQGRRMEQDIGRIEVTTRSIMNDLANLRKDSWTRHNQMSEMLGRLLDYSGPIYGNITAAREGIVLLLADIRDILTGIAARGLPTGEQAPVPTVPDPDATAATENLTNAVDANTEATVDASKTTDKTTDTVVEATTDLEKTVEKTGDELGTTVDTSTRAISSSVEKASTSIANSTTNLANATEKLKEATNQNTDLMYSNQTVVRDSATSYENASNVVAGAAAAMANSVDKNTQAVTAAAAAIRPAGAAAVSTVATPPKTPIVNTSPSAPPASAANMGTLVNVGNGRLVPMNSAEAAAAWGTTGGGVQMNFYGVTDPNVMADKIVQGMRSRGVPI